MEIINKEIIENQLDITVKLTISLEELKFEKGKDVEIDDISEQDIIHLIKLNKVNEN